MKKKIICIFLILILLVILGFFIYKNFIVKNNTNEEIQDYTPQEEISEKQLRETVVTLYFSDKENKNLIPEARKIDANNLIKNPYEYLINLLIEGPKNENLIKSIPEGTKINSVFLEGDILKIDLSSEFLNSDNLNNSANSILNTVTQLNEINGIKILINGEEDKNFKDTIYLEKIIKK